MNSERLIERTADYLKALRQLERACQQPFDEFIRDSVIQRFEFTYELAWKMLKLRLQVESVEANSPRQVFQEALQVGLIHDGNSWSEMQRMRNLTSHTYDESLAEQVYAFIAQEGLARLRQLAASALVWGLASP